MLLPASLFLLVDIKLLNSFYHSILEALIFYHDLRSKADTTTQYFVDWILVEKVFPIPKLSHQSRLGILTHNPSSIINF